MGFLGGFAAGFVGGLNDQMDDNRRLRDEARKDAFKNYREKVLPQWEENNKKAAALADQADFWTKQTGSKKFGQFILKNEMTDYNAIKAAAADFDFSEVQQPSPTGAASTGQVAKPAAAAAPTPQAAPTMAQGAGGASAATTPAQPAQSASTAQPTGMATPTNTSPSPAPAQTASGADAAKVMQGQGDSKVPERSMWDRMMGKPDYQKIRAEAIDQLASEYGVDRSEMQKRLTSNPVAELKKSRGADGGDANDGLRWKKPLDPIENALVANTLANIDRFSDRAAVMNAVRQFGQDRDGKRFGDALTGIGYMSKQDEMAFMRDTQLAVAQSRTHAQKIQDQALGALQKAGSMEELRKINPGAAAVLDWQIGMKQTAQIPALLDPRFNGGMGFTPPGASAPPAPSGSPAPAQPQAPSAPQRPASVPAGSAYSPSRGQWRDPSGKIYDKNGNPVK